MCVLYNNHLVSVAYAISSVIPTITLVVFIKGDEILGEQGSHPGGSRSIPRKGGILDPRKVL